MGRIMLALGATLAIGRTVSSQRDVEVVDDYNVVVAGGGVAG